jgi:hypothetical protein
MDTEKLSAARELLERAAEPPDASGWPGLALEAAELADAADVAASE